MINSVCGIRSTGRICTDLADTLQKNGHTCKIAYGRENVPDKYKSLAVRIGSSLDVKLHGVYSRLFDHHGFGSRRATKKFIEWVKEYDPDIIHLHNIHGYYINIEVLFNYLRNCKKKIIWTFHDCWAFTGHCVNLNECDKWMNKCFSCPKYKAYPKSFIDNSKYNFKKKRQLFGNAPNITIVTPSNWLAELTKKSFFKGSQIEVINNGIDINVFKPTYGDFRKKYGLENKKIVLGVASAWSKGKGLYDFIKLSSKLDDNYKIVLVGLTEKQKKELPQSIVGITRTNSAPELAEIYTAADVFVNLTYNDNYPTVNLEAQACGTPVITYRTGGSVESVIENCIVEQGDIDGIIEKIYSGNLGLKEGLVFDKNRMIEKYFELYDLE